jgi:hypothetical protein
MAEAPSYQLMDDSAGKHYRYQMTKAKNRVEKEALVEVEALRYQARHRVRQYLVAKQTHRTVQL